MEKLKTLQQIQFELKQWTDYNFGHQTAATPILGMIEEIGELSHAHLKQIQGIRKKDYYAAKKDAVADIIIYLLNYYNTYRVDIPVFITDRNYPVSKLSGYEYICKTVLQIGKLAKYNNATIISISEPSLLYTRYIYNNLVQYCQTEKIDLLTTVNEVWEQVKLRDWKKYPNNGITE